MDLSNLRLNRFVIHFIPRRPSADTLATPRYGKNLLDLGNDGEDSLTRRITEVLGNASNSIEMKVTEARKGSTFQYSTSLIDTPTRSESTFIGISENIADNLAQSQTHNNIPDSVLLICTGKAGSSANNVVVLVKAETQDGFNLLSDGGTIGVEFIRELFLTPNQKLYKVGLYLEMSRSSASNPLRNAEDFQAVVYDSNLRSSGKAAQYFYSQFLGCDHASSPKQDTEAFFVQSKKCFNETLNLTADERNDMLTHLYSYLKSPVNQISPTDFANQYFSDAIDKAEYLGYMEDQGLDRAVAKDTSLIDGKLKRRRIRFENGVSIDGTADHFDEKVRIEEELSDRTRITIYSAIDSQD